jgi:hypothetical protein
MMTELTLYTAFFVFLTGFFFGLGFALAGIVLAFIGKLLRREA